MNKEIIILEEPKIPTKWDYDQSVKKVRVLVYKWKNLTADFFNELRIAQMILSKPGSHESNWGQYCKDIGIEQNTANGWIRRFFLPVINHKEETPKLPEGKFNIFYVDPPWQFDNSGFEQSAQSIYETMPTEEIAKLAIPEMAEKDAVLFMWATNAMLEDAFDVMRAWGFIYKTNIVWIKDRAPGMGWFTQSKHELLLIGVNGNGLHPEFKPNSWQEAKVSKHSKKPDLFYDLIEKMYPNQKYIELFARNKREGWQSWGNQL